MDKKQQRSWFVRLRFPKVKNLFWMRSVGHIVMSRIRNRGLRLTPLDQPAEVLFLGVAVAAFVAAATDFRDHGTYAYWSTVPDGMAAARAAFAD